jgi:hypothetical protein
MRGLASWICLAAVLTCGAAADHLNLEEHLPSEIAFQNSF